MTEADIRRKHDEASAHFAGQVGGAVRDMMDSVVCDFMLAVWQLGPEPQPDFVVEKGAL